MSYDPLPRSTYQFEADAALEIADDLLAKADESGQSDWQRINYWMAMAQVNATLAIAAQPW